MAPVINDHIREKELSDVEEDTAPRAPAVRHKLLRHDLHYTQYNTMQYKFYCQLPIWGFFKDKY